MECIAVLGRHDEPTDGVEDYCNYLAQALALEGITLSSVRLRWAELGWPMSLQELLAATGGKRDAVFLLQYTALAWSRRGLTMRTVEILKSLKKNGARCAVVFHDPDGYAGNRTIDRLRRYLQRRTMKQLLQLSDFAVFTLALDKISWLPKNARNIFYIPVGANLPAPERAWTIPPSPAAGKPLVAIFSLSDQPARTQEVSLIAEAVSYAAKQAGPLQLVVMGRNSELGAEELRAQLSGAPVEVQALGLISAEEVVSHLGAADAMLFPRGSISTRRGSAIAGIACGLPVIAQHGSEVAPPITEAGVSFVPENSTQEFGPVLARVLTDRAYRQDLAERSRNAQTRYFSWSVIAKQYAQALRTGTTVR
jgi:glycosyltransferase involved in cell wall biosynthesis